MTTIDINAYSGESSVLTTSAPWQPRMPKKSAGGQTDPLAGKSPTVIVFMPTVVGEDKGVETLSMTGVKHER